MLVVPTGPREVTAQSASTSTGKTVKIERSVKASGRCGSCGPGWSAGFRSRNLLCSNRQHYGYRIPICGPGSRLADELYATRHGLPTIGLRLELPSCCAPVTPKLQQETDSGGTSTTCRLCCWAGSSETDFDFRRRSPKSGGFVSSLRIDRAYWPIVVRRQRMHSSI